MIPKQHVALGIHSGVGTGEVTREARFELRRDARVLVERIELVGEGRLSLLQLLRPFQVRALVARNKPRRWDRSDCGTRFERLPRG
jgi:hypothetical protein